MYGGLYQTHIGMVSDPKNVLQTLPYMHSQIFDDEKSQHFVRVYLRDLGTTSDDPIVRFSIDKIFESDQKQIRRSNKLAVISKIFSILKCWIKNGQHINP